GSGSPVAPRRRMSTLLAALQKPEQHTAIPARATVAGGGSLAGRSPAASPLADTPSAPQLSTPIAVIKRTIAAAVRGAMGSSRNHRPAKAPPRISVPNTSGTLSDSPRIGSAH